MLLITLCLTACASKQPAEKIVVRTIYVCPDLFFPEFPKPAEGIILPLDQNFKMIKSEVDENGEPVEVVWDIVPEWWLKLVLDYKLDNDVARSKYEAFRKSIPQKN